jgi:hypothetical protein
MPLSDKILSSLRQRPEKDSFNLASAYLHVLDVLNKLEQDEHDPDVLRDLAGVAIPISDYLKAVFDVLVDIIKD